MNEAFPNVQKLNYGLSLMCLSHLHQPTNQYFRYPANVSLNMCDLVLIVEYREYGEMKGNMMVLRFQIAGRNTHEMEFSLSSFFKVRRLGSLDPRWRSPMARKRFMMALFLSTYFVLDSA